MLFQRVSRGVVTIASGSWTKVTCKCCFTDAVRPLLVIELNKEVRLETKQWIISKIEAPSNKQGKRTLLLQGLSYWLTLARNDDGDMILVAAPTCTLLRNAEAMGLSKPYRDGTMLAFSYPDRASFKNADNIEELLTLAEQQYIAKNELDDLKAGTNESIPGCSKDKGSLYPGEPIFQKLEKSRIVKTMYPLHDKEKLSAFSKQWYSQFSSWELPLDYIHSYFGGPVAFYFSFLGFYTVSLLLPAVLGAVLYFLPWHSLNGHVLLAIFNVVWSTVFLELWKRRSAELAYGWGTLLLNSTFEEPRPNYRGTMGHNPVTKRWEPYFPSAERKRRIWFVSTPVGLFAEYIELFVQFGYLSLFSCVYPLTAALLFLNNVTEIRTDALKFCKLFRKPFVAPAANIGIWQTAFEALGFVSVISNCWLILISPQVKGYCQENGVSFRNALLCTIALEHVLIILKVVIAFVIPDLPKWVRIKVAQLEFRSRQALKTVA
ncbi:UNVERIFIED_CONTAM: hypothetical protein FKN15_066301 [Acipenser sinensis]